MLRGMKGSPRRIGRRAGFTLAEIVIALAVISVALLSAMGLLLSSNTLKQNTREFSLAQDLVAGEIERLKAYPAAGNWDGLVGSAGSQAAADLPSGTLTRAVDSTNPNLIKLTVTVTWVSNNQAKSHSEYVIVSR